MVLIFIETGILFCVLRLSCCNSFLLFALHKTQKLVQFVVLHLDAGLLIYSIIRYLLTKLNC